MARPPPPGCVLPPHTDRRIPLLSPFSSGAVHPSVARLPSSLPPAGVPAIVATSGITTPSARRERAFRRGNVERASIFRVKDGATNAIGPRRGLPRRVVVCGASHRSRLRPMRSPESQPLAIRSPAPPPTYTPTQHTTDRPTPLLATCSLAVLRTRSLVCRPLFLSSITPRRWASFRARWRARVRPSVSL